MIEKLQSTPKRKSTDYTLQDLSDIHRAEGEGMILQREPQEERVIVVSPRKK